MADVNTWATVIGPIGTGAVSSAVTWLFARKKNSADVTKVLTDAAAVATQTTTELLGGLKKEFYEMKKDFTEYKVETKARAKKHVEEFDVPLVREVRKLGGIVPNPVPFFD